MDDKEFRCQTGSIQNNRGMEYIEKSIIDNIRYAYYHIKQNCGERKTIVPKLRENEFMMLYEDMHMAIEIDIDLYDVRLFVRVEYE